MIFSRGGLTDWVLSPKLSPRFAWHFHDRLQAPKDTLPNKMVAEKSCPHSLENRSANLFSLQALQEVLWWHCIACSFPILILTHITHPTFVNVQAVWLLTISILHQKKEFSSFHIVKSAHEIAWVTIIMWESAKICVFNYDCSVFRYLETLDDESIGVCKQDQAWAYLVRRLTLHIVLTK